MIKNFITVKYLKNKIESKLNCEVSEYNKIQEIIFDQLCKQLKLLYPDSVLHVITNKYVADSSSVKYYEFPIESNHFSKFYIYDLLDKPAMYTDTDVLFRKKFSKFHLDADRLCYYGYSPTRIQSMTSIKIPDYMCLNAGICYIVPGLIKSKDLFDLNQYYFVDNKIKEVTTDEPAVTLLVNERNLFVNKTNKEVNVFRSNIKNINDTKYQSIHYTGHAVANKLLCVKEYKNKIHL